MQSSTRAPVLSATRNRDSCWITVPPRRLPRAPVPRRAFPEPPVLRLRERARLDDPHDVAHVRLVLRVVRLELDAAPDDLLVTPMRLDRVDLHDDRLVHHARDDDAAPLLATAAVGFRF